MSTNTIYCKKPADYILFEEFFCSSIKDAKEKKEICKRIYAAEDKIIKRVESVVFVFEHRNAASIRQMVKESNKKLAMN